ncbi:cupredoxin domain-containing protein [Candidatus Uhrbacteria bacterium]|nr:cupredoxin domain-containing protein [Candidatus Uhrbacteria bacterium]
MTLTPNIATDKQFDETLVTITIGSVSNGFVPTSTTVKKGKTVTWTNRDIVPHTVTGSAFDSGTLQPGQSYTRTFSATGSFDYACGIHPVMQGTINVVN